MPRAGWRDGLVILVVLGLCLGATVARARTVVESEISVGAGYGDALFRTASVPLPPQLSPSDLYTQVQPRLELGWEPSSQQGFRVGYDGSYQRFHLSENGFAYSHTAAGEYLLALTRALQLEVAAAGLFERYSAVASAAFDSGAASLALAYSPTRALRLAVAGESQGIDASSYSALWGGSAVEAAWSGAWLDLGARARFAINRHEAQYGGTLYAALRLSSLRFAVDGGWTHLTGGRWLAWGTAVSMPVGAGFAIVGRYRGNLEDYGPTTPALACHSATLGVRYVWESMSKAVAALLERADAGERPTTAGVHHVHVLLTTEPSVQRVALIGEPNDWVPAGLAFTRIRSGRFEMWLELPPGAYAYQLLVDGRPSVPTGAQAYTADSFGGENAVLLVPPVAGAIELSCCQQAESGSRAAR